MRQFTKDLYERYCSGDTVDEISYDTGISTDALYKRFQRIRKLLQEKSIEIKTQENYVSNRNKSQLDTNKWKDNAVALLVFASIAIGFFMYRKYFSQRNPLEKTK